MSLSTWFSLSILGTILAAIGGLGDHLLSHFRGRTLEAYCRLRGKLDRFGRILDSQQDARTAANYLFILGASLLLISVGTGYAIHLASISPLGRAADSVYTIAAMSIGMAAVLALLHTWLPKVCVQNSAAILLFHTWPLWSFVMVCSRPLGALESMFLAIGYRLSDRPEEEDVESESLEDEIRKMVIAGERDGLVTRSMRDMISGVMNLDEVLVSQIMTPRSKIDAINIEWPWDEFMRAVSQSGRTRLPVYRGSIDDVVGILFVKDLLSRLSHADTTGPIDIAPILREAHLIPGTRQIDELLKDFLVRRNHMAIVVDEFQQTIGVVTIEDALEEIVGEIADELDIDDSEPAYREDADGGFSIAGTLEIANANRFMSLDLPESDDYETVAGMILTQLGYLPKVGEKMSIGPFRVTITQASPRQIQRIHLVPKVAGTLRVP